MFHHVSIILFVVQSMQGFSSWLTRARLKNVSGSDDDAKPPPKLEMRVPLPLATIKKADNGRGVSGSWGPLGVRFFFLGVFLGSNEGMNQCNLDGNLDLGVEFESWTEKQNINKKPTSYGKTRATNHRNV